MSRCSHVSTAQGRSREPSTVLRSSSRASSAAGASDSDDGSVASTRGPPESARSVRLQNPRIAILGVAQLTGRWLAAQVVSYLPLLLPTFAVVSTPAFTASFASNLNTDDNTIVYMHRDASPTPASVDEWIASAAQHFSNNNSSACRRDRHVGRLL